MKPFKFALVAFAMFIGTSILFSLFHTETTDDAVSVSCKQSNLKCLRMEAEDYRQIFTAAQKSQNRWPIWKAVMPFSNQYCRIPIIEEFFTSMGLACYDYRNYGARSSMHWKKIEMINKDLSNMDLSVDEGSDRFLADIIFSQTNFNNSNLTNNTISGGHVEKSSFDGVVFTYGTIGNMSTTSFLNSIFRHGTIGGPWHSVDIQSSDFSGTDLAYSQFYKSRLANVSFDRANLEGVIFDNVEFDNVSFDGASLTNAILINQKGLSESTLIDLKAKGAIVDKWTLAKTLKTVDLSIIDGSKYKKLNIFYQRFISKTDLSGINMSSANFHSFFIYRCNISNSSFENANLKRTSFFQLDRDSHNINFKKANLVKASFIRNSYRNINFQQADLTDAYFNTKINDANFLGANLTGIKLGSKSELVNIKYNSRPFEINGKIVPPTIYEADFFTHNRITNAVDLSR